MSARSAHFGSALRTRLGSACEALTWSSLRWKRTATPSSRSWWVLSMPARHTVDNESGSSAVGSTACRPSRRQTTTGPLLPTPTATLYGSSGNGCPGDGRERYGHAGTPSLSSLARGVLPTPTKTDSRLGGSRNGPGSKAHHGVSLSDLVLTGSSTGRTLNGYTLAPSPSARDWKSTNAGPAMLARGNARPLSEWLGSTLGLHGSAVVRAISEWLMGFPPGWCASASPPMATRSSRTSRS